MRNINPAGLLALVALQQAAGKFQVSYFDLGFPPPQVRTMMHRCSSLDRWELAGNKHRNRKETLNFCVAFLEELLKNL